MDDVDDAWRHYRSMRKEVCESNCGFSRGHLQARARGPSTIKAQSGIFPGLIPSIIGHPRAGDDEGAVTMAEPTLIATDAGLSIKTSHHCPVTQPLTSFKGQPRQVWVPLF